MYSGALDLESFSLVDAYSRTRNNDFDAYQDDMDEGVDVTQKLHTESHIAFEMIHLPSEHEILALHVQNSVVVFVTRDWKVWMMDQDQVLSKPTFSLELPQKKSEEEFGALFVDPLGRHVIVTTTTGEAHYVSCTLGVTFRITCRSREGMCHLESVAWNCTNTSDVNTSAVLVGSRAGSIYELRINARSKSSSLELIHQIKNELDSIVGIEVQTCMDQPRRLVVLAVTRTRIYQFSGEGQYDSVFASYGSSSNTMPNLFEFPDAGNSGSTQRSTSLQIHIRGDEEHAHAFSWLTHAGIIHGSMDLTRAAIENDAVLLIKTPISLCRRSNSGEARSWDSKGTFPIAVTISEFHIYVLFENFFAVLSHPPGLPWMSTTHPRSELKLHDLNNRTVFTYPFGMNDAMNSANNPSSGSIASPARDLARGLAYDMSKQRLYAYTGTKLLELVMENEQAGAWWLYLERALDITERPDMREHYFDHALSLCKEDTERSDSVRIALGDFLITQKRYQEAIQLYAESNRSFEDTVMKLTSKEGPGLASSDFDARALLLQYLLTRIEVMRNRKLRIDQERKQMYCLCMWVVELYLERITHLDVTVVTDSLDDSREATKRATELAATQQRLTAFLTRNKDILDYETTLQLISTHGRTSEMIRFCRVHGNYAKAVEYHMNANELEAAVNDLATHCTGPDDAELWYLYSPRLIIHYPEKLIRQGWMGTAGSILNPRKLIPALTKYKPSMNESGESKIHYGLMYLQYVASKDTIYSTDAALQNLLLVFYAQQDDAAPLEKYLREERPCDSKFALRICLEGRKLRACVYIYAKMHLYEDAVALALHVKDIPLAKEQAGLPTDEEHRKRLWLRIARYVIENQKDVRSALQLIKESGVVKVEEVLPYLSDSVLIQDFKNEICRSLDDYAEEIKKLKADMEQATLSANDIRNDIKESRHRFGFVAPGEKCSLCRQGLLTRGIGFYIFPSCRHAFHKTCLWRVALPHLDPKTAERVALLSQRIECSSFPTNNNNAQRTAWSEQEVIDMKKELDDTVASACVFCGPFMVEEIDKPFGNNGRTQINPIGQVAGGLASQIDASWKI